MRHFLSLAIAFLSVSANIYSQANPGAKWVETTYEDLSEDARIGQLFLVPFTDQKSALFYIDHFDVGGFVLPQGAPADLAFQIKFLQEHAKVPLWIAIDKSNENASSRNLLPHSGTLASISDSIFLQDLGFRSGTVLQSVGANLCFLERDNRAYKTGLIRTSINVLSLENEYAGDIISTEDRLNSPLQFARRTVPQKSEEMSLLLEAIENGADIVFLEGDIINRFDDLRSYLKKGFKKKDLRQIVKKSLSYKFDFRSFKVNSSNLDLNYHLLSGTLLEYHMAVQSLVFNNRVNFDLPILNLSNQKFASLSNDNADGSTFRKGIDRYVKVDHMLIDQLAAMPEPMKSAMGAYNWLIIDISKNNIPVDFLTDVSKSYPKLKMIFYDNGSEIATQLPENSYLLWNQEPSPLAYDLVSQAIFGAVEVNGLWPSGYPYATSQFTKPINRLKYTAPEIVGMSSAELMKIDSIVLNGIEKKAMPGAQVLVAKNGSVVYQKSFGYHTYDAKIPVKMGSLYDIASLTKVVGTLQAVMYMVDKGLIKIDANLATYFPELKSNPKGRIIIKDILSHQAGLPSYYPFWANTLDKQKNLSPEFYATELDDRFKLSVTSGLYTNLATEDSLWTWIMSDQVKLRSPGRYLYSDIGFMILKKLTETMLNRKMDEFLEAEFYAPLGMKHTTFHPLDRFKPEFIVPTEEDKLYRKNIVIGYVHDQNAAMIGGVAGHAGIFSNTNDLAKLMQMQLQNGVYGGKQYFSGNLVKSFTYKQYQGNRRGLGWDKPSFSARYDNTSSFCSEETFGHTGFTGTAIWADPKENLLYIFLSNRTFPDSRINKLSELNIRNLIQDVIYSSLQAKINSGD
jgi:beta-N-acetylhexosaminidase